jgi:hypothetical protein
MPAGAAGQTETRLSLAQYVTTLDNLQSSIGSLPDERSGIQLAASLPSRWKVEADHVSFEIDTQALKTLLEQASKNPDMGAKQRLQKQLAALVSDARSFQEPAADFSRDRIALNDILARPEFRKVHGETWWDRVEQRIAAWVMRVLERIFGSSAIPVIGKVTVCSIIAIAVLLLSLWILRSMRRGAKVESVVPQSLSVSAKQWRTWMTEAQAAAASGKWRDAIHLAYWAGISFLEEAGMWRPSRARTPREYLRLLPRDSQYAGHLSELTRRFEVVWYGYREAGPDSYAETVTNLEKLGCHWS